MNTFQLVESPGGVDGSGIDSNRHGATPTRLSAALSRALPARRWTATRAHVPAAVLVAALALAAGDAQGQNMWLGPPAGVGDWTSAANWSMGVPNATSPALIDNTGTAEITTGAQQAAVVLVGATASGGLTVRNGATLQSDFGGAIGGFASSFGSVEIRGSASAWTMGAQLLVGADTNGTTGTGTLAVLDGATLNAASFLLGATSALTVRGAGSRFVIAGGSAANISSTGTILVRDGGALSADRFTSDGSLRVEGTNARVTANTLQARQLVAAGGATVEAPEGGFENASFDGAGTVGNIRQAAVAAGPVPRGIQVTGGAELSTTTTRIGVDLGVPNPIAPVLSVDGAGSRVRADSVRIGDGSSGTVTLQNGGRLESTSVVEANPSAGSTAVLNVGVGGNAGVLDTPRFTAIGTGTSIVNFNHVDDVAVRTVFGGPLNVNKLGRGTTQLSGLNTYAGRTQVDAGSLRAGVAGAFSPNSAHVVAGGATLDLAGFNQTLSALDNSGAVSLVGSAPGATLTMTGPYVGNGGVLRMGTTLGGNGSATDRLVLDGRTATATGNTAVQIVNLGGLGAQTTGNGIEVITAQNGATTTAQTTQNAFALLNGTAAQTKGAALRATSAVGGHVDAGAYEYRLYAADANGAGENWYLRSTSPVVLPPGGDPGGTTGTTPGGTPDNVPGGATGGTGTPTIIQVPTYRAEAPLFASIPAQLRQGSFAMLSNRHQRIGDDDVATTEATAARGDIGERRAWGRIVSTDLDIRQSGTVSPKSEGRFSGFQAGTDLFANREWRAGVYVGQLDGDSRVNGFASGIADLDVGRTDLRSRFVGAYGTWTPESGWYVDTVLQAGRHRYSVQRTPGLGGTSHGDSLLASVEVGKSLDLGGAGKWKVEPSVQLAHQRLSLDDSTIAGAVVQQETHSGWIARAGVRVKGEIATGAGLLQPYVRVNLYRSSGGNDLTRFVGPAGSTDIASAAGGSSTELAAGVTLALNERTSLYGEVGKLWSSGGDARIRGGLQGSLGVRVRW